jgi:hypothetical protein
MFLGAGSEGYRADYWAIWYAVGDIGGALSTYLSLAEDEETSKILGS